MSIQPKSPLLRLSVELRLEIYRYFWTIPYDRKYNFLYHRVLLKATYIKAQLSAICTLGAICRTIRDEAYDEYFHTTQIYLGWEDKPSTGGFSNQTREALELIQGSYLLKTYAQHICVRWVHVPHRTEIPEFLEIPTDYGTWTSMGVEQLIASRDIALDCLATRFQNAVTLEIVCEHDYLMNDIWYYHRDPEAPVEDGYYYDPLSYYNLPLNLAEQPFDVIPDSYYDDEYSDRIRSLRFPNLEKAIVRTCEELTHPDAVNWFNKDCSKWFRRFERDVATLVTATRKEGGEPKSYTIKNHIGNLYEYWPRSYKV